MGETIEIDGDATVLKEVDLIMQKRVGSRGRITLGDRFAGKEVRAYVVVVDDE